MDKVKKITAEQTVRLAKKFGVKLELKEVSKLKNGSFLFKRVNLEKKITTYYRLQKFYIKKFNKKYSCNNKIKSGSELMISNFKLPKGSVIL